jgi:hypothetical protein
MMRGEGDAIVKLPKPNDTTEHEPEETIWECFFNDDAQFTVRLSHDECDRIFIGLVKGRSRIDSGCYLVPDRIPKLITALQRAYHDISSKQARSEMPA